MDSSRAIRTAYDAWADQYDTDENRTRDLNARVLRQQSFDLDGSSVLEIGCGTGANTHWLAERGARVLAVDISDAMLTATRERTVGMDVTVMQADLTEPWIIDDSFDLIVANLVLEHVDDLRHVFDEAHRVLRAGGVMYIGELHPYRQIRGSQARFRDARTGDDVLVPAFAHQVSEFVNAAIASGFAVRQLGEWCDERDDQPRLLTARFQRLGRDGLLATARASQAPSGTTKSLAPLS